MAPEINIITTVAGTPKRSSYRALVFFIIGVSFLITGKGFSASVDSLKTIGHSSAASTSISESMPLWGGGASLNIPSQAIPFDEEINLHHFDDIACGNCHQAPVASGDLSFSEEKTDWKRGVDINRSCTSLGCHEYDRAMNHPVGVSIPANISDRMRPNQSSEMTCLTCHESGAMVGSAITEERFLTSPDQTICQSCHGEFAGSLKQRSHWKFSQKAHLVSLVPDSVTDGNSDDLMVSGIDLESQSCLSCHDEVSATVPAMNGRDRWMSRGYNMSDHPIGMNYQSVLSENSMYFNSLHGDQNRIRMFDGNIGCGSCHSLYSQTPFHLAVENSKNTLCRECHNR